MSIFDIVLLVIISGFGLFGLWFGLVDTLVSLVGTVVAVYFASRYYEPVANWLQNLTGWGANFSKVLIFILAFIIITRIVGLIFWVFRKILKIFTRIPFIRGLDRILGLVFGLVEGVIFLGISLFFISRFPLGETFMSWMVNSQVAPGLVKIASLLWPLLPEALKILRSTVEGII